MYPYKIHKRPFKSQRSSTRLDNHYEVEEEGVESAKERPGDETERRRRKKKHHRHTGRESPEKTIDQTIDTTRTTARRYMDESAVSTRHVALAKKSLHVTYSDDALEDHVGLTPRDPKADGSSKEPSEKGSHKYVR